MTEAEIPQVLISIGKPASNFSEHLASNSRILFSGAFGIGKTFFLKHFFEMPEMKEKYNVFHLFPVNYQIATNEDVFELMKYDIAYLLFGFGWFKVDTNEFSKMLAFHSYLSKNKSNIASRLIKSIPWQTIGNAAGGVMGATATGTATEIEAGAAIGGATAGTMVGITEGMGTVYNDFCEYHRKINENDAALLTELHTQMRQKKGSIYEFDAISEFIYKSLKNCDNGETDKAKHKENILIIDDLDRIDPEHIFRLLNVFSAHMDIDANTNKFGFDKIIFVCDVENIRNIFSVKYGQRTDFSGYIDKFYSSEVFHFNNKTAISEFVGQLIRDRADRARHDAEFQCVGQILDLFIEGKSINLRQILANANGERNTIKDAGYLSRRYYSSGYAVIWMCFKILGSQMHTLRTAFENLTIPIAKTSYYGGEWLNAMSRDMLPLLALPVFMANRRILIESEPCDYEINGQKINFSIHEDHHTENIYAKLESPSSIDFDMLKHIILKAITILDEKRLLV